MKKENVATWCCFRIFRDVSLVIFWEEGYGGSGVRRMEERLMDLWLFVLIGYILFSAFLEICIIIIFWEMKSFFLHKNIFVITICYYNFYG